MRRDLYIADWEASKELKRKLLFKVGEGPGTLKLDDLGIERGEISFQWFIQINKS
jgi:predicted Ser/Thr protein kinase